MIVSKLTSKAQTTIPQPVRAALRLKPGDELVYEIVDQKVILTKVQGGTKTDDRFRTFKEWNTEADAKAYADL
jgi:antitoxin PrlF